MIVHKPALYVTNDAGARCKRSWKCQRRVGKHFSDMTSIAEANVGSYGHEFVNDMLKISQPAQSASRCANTPLMGVCRQQHIGKRIRMGFARKFRRRSVVRHRGRARVHSLQLRPHVVYLRSCHTLALVVTAHRDKASSHAGTLLPRPAESCRLYGHPCLLRCDCTALCSRPTSIQ